MAHAAGTTIATVEKIHDGNLLDDPVLAAGTLPGFYVETVAVAERGARPLPLPDHYPPMPRIWRNTRDGGDGRKGFAIISTSMYDKARGGNSFLSLPLGIVMIPPGRPGSCEPLASSPPPFGRISGFRDEELLADVITRLIGDVRHIAVGNASPIPATAALLARERGAGRPYVSLLQSRKHNFFTDGARELFDCAGQGRIDVFFLSGGQIDGQGNVNLVSTGDYEHPKVRFPGSFGSAYLYYVVPKVILFRLEHSRRTLVRHVDFISAPGKSEPNVYRPGGPIALVTNRCLFAFDNGRFRLTSVHPGHTVADVIENTGFEFDMSATVPETPAPTPATLKLMREAVAPQLAEVYPQFAAQVFGAGQAAVAG